MDQVQPQLAVLAVPVAAAVASMMADAAAFSVEAYPSWKEVRESWEVVVVVVFVGMPPPFPLLLQLPSKYKDPAPHEDQQDARAAQLPWPLLPAVVAVRRL